MQLRLMSADDLRQALPMAAAIQAMKAAYSQFSAGQADMPLRSRIVLPDGEGVALFMPALLQTGGELAVKIVSVVSANAARGLPTIHAAVVALDSETGQPTALLEGGSLTAIRTGAGSGAATDVLAPSEAHTLAVLGSGVQARTQLEAVCTIRQIGRVRVYSPTAAHRQRFAGQMAGVGPIPEDVIAVDSASEAIADADIICAATTASSPVFDGAELKPGAHVNAVGSFTPEMEEIDVTTLRRSLVVVDSREAVMAEAGDLIGPMKRGEISAEGIHAEIGQILNGISTGRTSPEQITCFKSVGLAVQDAAAAVAALQGAEAQGLGQLVEL